MELGRTDNRTMEHADYIARNIGGPQACTSITVPPVMYDDFVKVCEPLTDYNPEIPFRESDVFGLDFNYRDIWHTEDDLYDKLIPEYLEHSAVIQAVTAYGLANLPHLLSREGLYKE